MKSFGKNIDCSYISYSFLESLGHVAFLLSIPQGSQGPLAHGSSLRAQALGPANGPMYLSTIAIDSFYVMKSIILLIISLLKLDSRAKYSINSKKSISQIRACFWQVFYRLCFSLSTPYTLKALIAFQQHSACLYLRWIRAVANTSAHTRPGRALIPRNTMKTHVISLAAQRSRRV